MKQVWVVFNPVSGKSLPSNELRELLRPLERDGWTLHFEGTTEQVSATELARRACRAGCQLVVAAGGDGTINEAMQALVGTEVALGVLPLGTGNVWAKEMHIPLDPARAVEVLGEGHTRCVDVGVAEGRYFLLMAGVGYDAAVTRETNARAKRHLGIFAYMLAGIPLAISYYGHRTTLVIDGSERHFRALMVVISNTRSYGGLGGLLTMAPNARLDDGLLDVCVFKGTGLLETLWHMLMVALGRHLGSPSVAYYRGSEIVVLANPPFPVQVDGDAIGTTPMRFEIRPRALKVVVPGGPREDLFVESRPTGRLG